MIDITTYKRKENISNILIILSIILLLLIPNIKCNIDSQQQVQYQYLYEQSIPSLIFKPKQHQIQYKSLLATYKDVMIETKLIVIKQINTNNNQNTKNNKKNHKKQQVIVLFQRNTTFILQQQFLSMYKNKLTFKFPINLTTQFLINLNNIYIKNSYFVQINEKYYKYDQQIVPLSKKFKKYFKQGLQPLLLADHLLFKYYEESQPKIINKFEIYLFQIDHALYFNKSINKEVQQTQFFKVYKFPFTKNGMTSRYYYPRPISSILMPELKENYKFVSSLRQNTIHWLQFQIKITSDLFPLIAYCANRFQYEEHIQTSISQNLKGFDTQTIQEIRPLMINFLKNLFLDGSKITWILFILQFFIGLLTPIAKILIIYYSIKFYSNAKINRGMSIYSIYIGFISQILIILSSFFFVEDYMPDYLILISFYLVYWKLKQLGTFFIDQNFPYIRHHEHSWYKVYQKQDNQAFSLSCKIIIGFGLIVITYPFLFQNYFSLQGSQNIYLLIKYTVLRLQYFLTQYQFIMILLPQIILNYKLKSGRGRSWKYLIWSIPAFSFDNLGIIVSTSYLENIYYLKQDICIFILIAEKLKYGDKIAWKQIEQEENQEEKKQQKPENEKENEKQNKQTQDNLKQLEQNKQKLQKIEEKTQNIHIQGKKDLKQNQENQQSKKEKVE